MMQEAKRTLSRRHVLQTAALAPAMAAALSSKTLGAEPSGDRVPNTQLSLAAYSVRDIIRSREMDLFDFIDWCRELDLPGAELTSYYFPEGFDRAYLHRLRLHAFRNGVTVSGTAVGNNFCLPPGPEREKQIEDVKKWIDHAVEFYAPHIRIFAGNVPEGVEKKTAIGWVADAIKKTLEHAERRGVILGLENHGGITARAADQLAICEAVGEHPCFGINLDTGNFRTNPYEELALIAPLAVNVQVKVLIRQPDGSRGTIDFERLKEILSDAGYRGWVTLEYEEEDPIREVPKYVQKLRQVFEGCA